MAHSENLFWDSCVFGAYLYDQSGSYDTGSIKQFLDEARGDRLYNIFASSISLAEVSSRKIRIPSLGSLADLFDDYMGHINVIDPSPNIMIAAGKLRELRFKKVGSPRSRVLSVPDAIMFSTCFHLQDAFGITIDYFHTFDDVRKERKIACHSSVFRNGAKDLPAKMRPWLSGCAL